MARRCIIRRRLVNEIAPSELSTDQLINIYSIFSNSWDTNLDRRTSLLNVFSTFIVTVTGFVIVGISQLYESRIVIYLLVGPVANVMVCLGALREIKSLYVLSFEYRSITAKLEQLIGLTKIRGQSIIPNRLIAGTDLTDFPRRVINNMPSCWTFRILFLVNITLACIIFYLYL